jgi:hypothetical protein
MTITTDCCVKGRIDNDENGASPAADRRGLIVNVSNQDYDCKPKKRKERHLQDMKGGPPGGDGADGSDNGVAWEKRRVAEFQNSQQERRAQKNQSSEEVAAS